MSGDPASRSSRSGRRKALIAGAWTLVGAAVLIAVAAYAWRVEILRWVLDPGVPYQVYTPPPAPDYTKRDAWALLPSTPGSPSGGPGVDVFFVHPTTYTGGRDWNAPIGEPDADRLLFRVMIPNYAGPFQSLGRVFAPRYRQASLYAFSTLRDDAREARRFPFTDVQAAFRTYLDRWNAGRPLIVAGVEQGGLMAARLVQDAVARDPGLRARLVAVYLIGVVTPADAFGRGSALPACQRRAEAGCVLGWAQAPPGGETAARVALDRAVVWSRDGQLENLDGRPALCVNPLTGTEHGSAEDKANLGAVNAGGLEWGLRPAFLPRQVSAECRGGLLWASRPHSPDLRSPSGWIAQLRAPPFNLFYADIEADARARIAAFQKGAGGRAPPIVQSVSVGPTPVHRIDPRR